MFALIFTTYKPDSGFIPKCESLLPFCDLIILSDNTPGGADFNCLPNNVVHIKNMVNLGLSSAINIALKTAAEYGVDVVSIFDQDSSPAGDLLIGLKADLLMVQESSLNFVCLGPTHIDDEKGVVPSAPDVCHVGKKGLREVTCLPTSGITFTLARLGETDIFSANYFLDFADFDWCWRIRASGGKCYRSSALFMLHRLGEGERKIFGIKFYIPAPFRHYFQFRDTLWLCRDYNVPIYSKFRLLCVLPIKLILYPVILDSGYERLSWMLAGVRDFFLGIRGIGAANKVIS